MPRPIPYHNIIANKIGSYERILCATHNVLFAIILCFLLFASATFAASPPIDPELRQALKEAVNDSSSFEDKYDAEVWLMDMSSRLERWSRMKDKKERMRFLTLLHSEATRAGVPPELVLAVIQIESAFDQYAISVVGAQGFMQVMPFWKNEIGRDDDNLMNAATNLRYGCAILKHYLDREKGDFIRGLARYNGSLGRTKYPEKVLLAWERNWFINH